jgi:hypothetical protein
MRFSNILLIFLALLFFIIFIYTLFIFIYKDKKNLCDNYHSQQIKYDLCKECNKENKCYDDKTFTCIPCKTNMKCEELYKCSNPLYIFYKNIENYFL